MSIATFKALSKNKVKIASPYIVAITKALISTQSSQVAPVVQDNATAPVKVIPSFRMTGTR